MDEQDKPQVSDEEMRDNEMQTMHDMARDAHKESVDKGAECDCKMMRMMKADGGGHRGHIGEDGPHQGHGGTGGKDKRRGAGTPAREKFDFLNERLSAGNLKPGEQEMIESRMEKLAKEILGVEEKAMGDMTMRLLNQDKHDGAKAMHNEAVDGGAECDCEMMGAGKNGDEPQPDPEPAPVPEDEPPAKSNALKAISETDDELVVGNHIVVFGGRDLTGYAIGKNADGSLGEYFTPNTDLESDYTKTGRLYVDFEHGRDPDEAGNTKHNILGYVDWKTKSIDDDGVFVKRVLYRRNKYVRMLEPLIKAGLIGNSSEAIPDETHKAANGEILKWGLHRDTLTVTPMEPRMLDANALAAVKALSNIMPELKSLLPSKDTALTVEEDMQTKTNKQPIQREIHKEKKTMDELEVKNAVAKAVADALATERATEKAVAEAKAARDAELKAAADAAYKQAIEDIRANPAKTFYHSTEPTSDDNDGVQAFKSWMGTGQANSGLIRPDSSFNNIPAAKAAWNVTDGATGGYLVPDPLYNQIIAKRNIASWVRQVPCQYFETPADHILVPREDTSMTDFVLTAEAGSYNENEGNVAQKDLILYKYTKLTKVSEEFLMYNGTNWESWFANALGRAVAGTENTIYTTGTGTSEPEGIVAGATVANTTATTDVILPSELAALIGYLGEGYNVPAECAMLMANVTKWYLKGITGNNFNFVSTPQDGDFFSYPAVVNDDLEAYTTASAKCIVFGNMTHYAVAEKPGMIVQRNPYLYQATGQIGIFASIFRGGGVLQGEAFYYLTNKSS
jgi:HK97 family phage major capsid protein